MPQIWYQETPMVCMISSYIPCKQASQRVFRLIRAARRQMLDHFPRPFQQTGVSLYSHLMPQILCQAMISICSLMSLFITCKWELLHGSRSIRMECRRMPDHSIHTSQEMDAT